MVDLIKRLLTKLGVNKAIAYSSLARIVQAGGGIFTVFFIAGKLTAAEQGYYYTFGSLLAIQIFFELGLGQIITQYVAYEAAFLTFSKQGILVGEGKYISRLSSLFHLFSKWYVFISFFFLVVLILLGFSFFSRQEEYILVHWKFPWILLVLSSTLNLFVSPYISFIEGIGKVKEVAFMRFVSQSLQILCVWIVLLVGGKLWALGVSSFCIFIVSVYFIFRIGKNFLLQISSYKEQEKISYKNEIFPYQWRIALSWVSGYFIFQLFNPVLFAYSGPVVAGQMGMTLAVLNGITALTLSWTSTKIPLWSGFVSKREYGSLDASYSRTWKESSWIALFCFLVFIIFLEGLHFLHLPLYNRFLPFPLSIVLVSTVLANNIVNIWATYLRCHKKEPFLFQAVSVGFLTAVSTFYLGKEIGVNGMVWGYTLIIYGISLPLSYYIFKLKQKQYHG